MLATVHETAEASKEQWTHTVRSDARLRRRRGNFELGSTILAKIHKTTEGYKRK